MPPHPDRRPPLPRHLQRYEDDDFDGDRYDEAPSQPTLAGMYGFIVAMVSLGLIGVVAVLYFLLKEEHELHDDRTLWMFLWFFFLDTISFFGALAATVLGARGVSRSNRLFRGYSVAALILGIVELAVTSTFGMIFFCCSTFLAVHRGGFG